MSENETILIKQAGTKVHTSESPPSIGLRAGAFAEVGTLILTNRRLVFVSKGGPSRATAWALGGAIAALAVEKTVSRAEIDDLTKYEGSYAIALSDISKIEAGSKLGSSFIRIDSDKFSQKPVRCFVFNSNNPSKEDWVNTINSAKLAFEPTNIDNSTLTNPTEPPPPPPSGPYCPTCGKLLSYIEQYQRWYCYNEQKYV
ncbi:MAG: hypothetical protein GX638_04550 [Crenarchaeota archaeon]|nr:hypothetical protein [Thermoproteota archaeon]